MAGKFTASKVKALMEEEQVGWEGVGDEGLSPKACGSQGCKGAGRGHGPCCSA